MIRASHSIFVFIVWLCFVARGCFYCSFVPLWEGYDEWAHFGFIERIVDSDKSLIDRSDPVSLEVQTSMYLAPAPYGTGKPSTIEDDFWRLGAGERDERARKLREIPTSWSHQADTRGSPIYEALQPPLYYWISSLLYRLVATRPLLERVFLLRYLSVFICSLAIPVVFLIARRVSGNIFTGLFVITLFCSLPELMIDVGRIGNECLGILLFTCLTLLALLGNDRDISPKISSTILTGTALGLGLITKAYFLTALPALGLLYLWRMRRTGQRPAWMLHSIAVFVIAFLIGGWWYIRNRILTGTWSGLLEAVKVVHYSGPQYWAGAMKVDWRNAIDSILFSHIWFGDWSSLHVRSWIYHVFFLIAGVGAAGLGATLVKNPERRRRLFPLLLVYGFFWLGQLYNVLLLFLTKGASTSMGWYMYCVVASEITLLAVGIQALTPVRSGHGVCPR